MNYLELGQDLKRECGISGTLSTVIGQTGELERAVNWVKDAWNELQNRHHNWRWMRSTWSKNTVAGTDAYAGTSCTDTRVSATVTRFARWWPFDDEGCLNVNSYLLSAGVGTEGFLIFLPWASFRSIYRRGTQTNNVPAHFTIDPQNRLVLGPKPNDVYVLSGEYQMSAQGLALDADTPEIPTQFHKVIVYEAMKKVAGYDAASEIYVRAEREGHPMLRALEADQLPELVMAGPLA